ncbi:transposase domain-containing protein [Salmonella enterica]
MLRGARVSGRGECGALLYRLIGTCRLNGIDPEAYLRNILSVLPEWSSNKVAELLPWNVDLTNKLPSIRRSLTAYLCSICPGYFLLLL